MKYDLRKMTQLVAVAQASSFSKAAKQLHITQPALSRNVAAMELEIGVKVFDRGRGGASLTPVGKLVIEEVEGLLKHADRLDHNLKHFGRGDAGKISFGLGPMVGSLLLSDMAVEFLNLRPKLHLHSVIKSASELMHELLNHRIELFVCGREQLQENAQLGIQSIANVPIASIVRAGHPLAQKKSVGVDELLQFPVLAGMELPPTLSVGGELICDNYHILRDSVRRCNGVWLTTPLMVAPELAAGEMVALNITDRSQSRQTEICLVHRQGYTLSPAGAHVRDFIVNYFA